VRNEILLFGPVASLLSFFAYLNMTVGVIFTSIACCVLPCECCIDVYCFLNVTVHDCCSTYQR